MRARIEILGATVALLRDVGMRPQRLSLPTHQRSAAYHRNRYGRNDRDRYDRDSRYNRDRDYDRDNG